MGFFFLPPYKGDAGMDKVLKISVKYTEGSVLHPSPCYRFAGMDAESRIKEYGLKDGAGFEGIQRMIEREDWRNMGCEKNPIFVEVEILGDGDGLRSKTYYDFLWRKMSRKTTSVIDAAGIVLHI